MTRIPILLYHSISGRASERFRPWTLGPELFEEHMALLADRQYVPVTLSHLVDAVWGEGRDLPVRPVLLTFDDGFADFHTTALPVLERHGFASTLYVTTGFVGRTARWLAREGEDDRPMLGWDDLRDAADRGTEIGAHSHTHPRLDELTSDTARDEILRSKGILEDALVRPVRTLAYPHGYHGPRIRRLVVQAGYDAAVAVRHAMSSARDDRFGLARIIVYDGTSADALDGLLRGEGLPQAPFPEGWRTTAWRLARKTSRSVTTAVGGGART